MIDFVCPSCRAALALEQTESAYYACSDCGRTYPVVLGIPDFRLAPDPWIGLEADREKGRRLLAHTRDLSFADTVRAYWAMTPETPRARADHFTNTVLAADVRLREWLARVERSGADAGTWLDIGCGTGDLLVAGAEQGIAMIGIDVAFRWLVIARKRLDEAGVAAPLVCCNAEHLPFADRSVARVLSVSTLEHCRDARSVLGEARRVLRTGGAVHVRTVNRYTLLREPHVGIWGVGLVPRRWADAFVRWRSRQRYLHHHPLSRRELSRALVAAGFHAVEVQAATLLPSERVRLGRHRWISRVYEAIRRTPAVGAGLSWIAPLVEAKAAAI